MIRIDTNIIHCKVAKHELRRVWRYQREVIRIRKSNKRLGSDTQTGIHLYITQMACNTQTSKWHS